MQRLFILLLAALMLPLSGCFYSREIAHTRRDIERQTGAELDREIVLNLGPASLRTAGWIAGLVPEEDAQMARAYLRDVRRVKVGVYRVEYMPSSLEALELPGAAKLERQGWEVLAKIREDDEVVHVYYRERRDAIRDLYVMVLSDDELVITRVKGDLSNLVARAIHDHADWSDWSDWDDVIEVDY